MVAACGGGAGGSCSPVSVTDTTGDIVTPAGVVISKGSSTTHELCCTAGTVTTTTQDQPSVNGGPIIKGSTTTSCRA